MKYLYLNSKDNNFASKDNSNVQLKIDEPIDNRTLRLKHFEIANSHYNVTSKNNKLELDSSAVTLTPGSYTLTSLMTHVDTQLTASNSHNFTVSYDNDTGYMTISSATGNFTLDFDVTDSCADLLGFGVETTYSGASTYTGSFIPELSDSIFIDIERFSSEYLCSDSKRPTFVISNNQARHDIIYFNEKNDFEQIAYSPSGPSNIVTVLLKDSFNQQLTNASNWKMILELM